MSLSGVSPTGRLSRAERAREPRSLGVVAWFDGWSQGLGIGSPAEYPRLLDAREAREWRDGFREGRANRAEVPASLS